MKLTGKTPLFVVTGASGVGKSTVCDKLFDKENKYIVLESDILWEECFNKPENLMKLCRNISRSGIPVVLCGRAVPKQFESCGERKNFSSVYYLAIVSDENTLASRMKNGRNIQDEKSIKGSVSFNNWLLFNANTELPKIDILDYSSISPEEAAEKVDRWIRERI